MISAVTWNVEWRKPGSRDGDLIRDRMQQCSPDIVCLTEGHAGFFDGWGGFVAEGASDWGGATHETRRKVMLWSRRPWTKADTLGATELPPGRFITAETETNLGSVTVLGLVIPYHLANVSSGRRDRRMWDEHRQYLEVLPNLTAALPARSLVLGDLNQRIPSSWVPRRYQTMLATAFAPLRIATTDLRGPDGRLLVDHIACGPGLRASDAQMISNLDELGHAIGDHCGVTVTLDAVR